MIVFIRDNQVEAGNKVLKRKMQRAGVYKELRFRKHYEKPCEINKRRKDENRKKILKSLKKRMEREGF